jgi:hypothetical protein
MKWTDFTLLFCLILAGCTADAERNNPLDPKSGNFDNSGNLSGRVMRFYSPFAPITDAEIRLEPGPLLALTDNAGNFQLFDLQPGRYKISAIKTGYASYSDSVEISTQQTSNKDFNLNGLPVISGVTITTQRISRWFPTTDVLSFEIIANVSDPDGVNDISTVRLTIPQLNFEDSLNPVAPGIFSKQYLESTLPGRNLFNLVGHNLEVMATDNVGYTSASVEEKIVRIISEVPVAVSPVALQRLSNPQPELTWRQETVVPYKFTYRLDLFRDDSGITTTIETQPGISGEQTTTRVTNNLTTGRYFWTISIVDEFGNTSRSKEAAFEIN